MSETRRSLLSACAHRTPPVCGLQTCRNSVPDDEKSPDIPCGHHNIAMRVSKVFTGHTYTNTSVRVSKSRIVTFRVITLYYGNLRCQCCKYVRATQRALCLRISSADSTPTKYHPIRAPVTTPRAGREEYVTLSRAAQSQCGHQYYS